MILLFFEEMSTLLDTIIKELKANAISYEEYLKKIAELAKTVNEGKSETTPDVLKTPAQRALYNNLGKDENLAIQIDEAVKRVKKADFRGNLQKENEVKSALHQILNNKEDVERIFAIVKQQREY